MSLAGFSQLNVAPADAPGKLFASPLLWNGRLPLAESTFISVLLYHRADSDSVRPQPQTVRTIRDGEPRAATSTFTAVPEF